MAGFLLLLVFVVTVGGDIYHELSSFPLVQCFAYKRGGSLPGNQQLLLLILKEFM